MYYARKKRREEKRRERERETRDKKETLLVLLFYNEKFYFLLSSFFSFCDFLKFFDIFHTLNKRIRGAGSFSFQSAFACVHSSLSLSRQNTKQRHHHRASQNKELENNKKTKKTFFYAFDSVASIETNTRTRIYYYISLTSSNVSPAIAWRVLFLSPSRRRL